MDKNGNGSLSREELLEAFKKFRGGNFNETEIDELITMADSDRSGEINYQEYIVTAIDRTKLLSNDKLEGAFRMFDKDKSNTISLDEIQELLDACRGLDEDLVKKAMKSVDKQRKGELSLTEFKELIQKLFQ